MPKLIRKTRSVAFRVDPEIADFLKGIPNASDFIRQAVIAELGMRCPLCNGRGYVSIRQCLHFAMALESVQMDSQAGMDGINTPDSMKPGEG